MARACLIAAAVMIASMCPLSAQKVTSPEDLVALHLDSIAKPAQRSSIKSRLAQGPAQMRVIAGGSGTLEGKSVLVSEGEKLHFLLKFSNTDYRGETFIYDGKSSQVNFSTPTSSRSPLGEFVWVQDAMLREGLWGGVLSTAWPLLDINQHSPKLNYQGVKEIDGHSVHDLNYRPKKNTDLEIHLYFDSETGRHVKTLYTMSRRPTMVHNEANPTTGIFTYNPDAGYRDNPASSEVASARQQQTRYRLEERFSDFKMIDGFNVPTHYTIRFAYELQDGNARETEWDIRESDVTSNLQLDPRNFAVR